jgi:hypothetical protein
MAGIRAYNGFLKAIKAARGISHKEAQQAYRGISERLGRAPKAKDVSAHPRITREEAKKAAGDIKREERRRIREVEKAIEKARKEPPRRAGRKGRKAEARPPAEAPPPAGPVVDRGGNVGGAGGSGGPGGASVNRRAVAEFEEDYGYYEDDVIYDYEDPLEDTGEGAE